MQWCQEETRDVSVNHYSNVLQSDDRRQRRKALEEIAKEISDDKSEVRSNLLQIIKLCVRCFSDNAEICREASIAIVIDAVNIVSDIDEQIFSYILPVLVQRIGDKEIQEPCEEVRLRLIVLLHSIVVKFSEKLALYVDDIIIILSRTIPDVFPLIKVESCECTIDLVKLVPQHANECCEHLIRPLLQNFKHQHNHVRSAAIRAIGTVIRYGKSKDVDTVAVPLAERLFDTVVSVRISVIQVVADWLCNLPDRYSFFHRLIPLILTSLNDENEIVREQTLHLWENIGIQYAKENENDLKDKMDYLTEHRENYPPGLSRPNLGCRELVQRHLLKVITAACGDMEDWRVDVRFRTSQLLVSLIQYAEQNIMQHLARLLPILLRAARENEKSIVENVERSCELLGHFVPADLWTKQLLPQLEDSHYDGELHALAAVINGAKRSGRRDHVATVTEFLAHKNMCWTRKVAYQEQLLQCCAALIGLQGECHSTAHGHLFFIIISVLGLTKEQKITDKALDVFLQLAICEQCSVEDLFDRYLLPVLEDLQKTAGSWTVHSSERFIFEAILKHAGTIFGQHAAIVQSILKSAMKPENHAEVRLKSITVLSDVFADKQKILKWGPGAASFITSFIQDVAVPNMAWRAGRSAEAVRTACLACVWAALNPASCAVLTDPCIVAPLASGLFPTLLGLIEDRAQRSRQLALYSLCRLVALSKSAGLLNAEHISQISPVVMERLDDVNDEVRSTAVETIVLLFNDLPADYNVETSIACIEMLYRTLLIHLDDPNETFQETMLKALKELSHISPNTLYERLDSTKHSFRNAGACNKLLDYLRNMLKISDVQDS